VAVPAWGRAPRTDAGLSRSVPRQVQCTRFFCCGPPRPSSTPPCALTSLKDMPPPLITQERTYAMPRAMAPSGPSDRALRPRREPDQQAAQSPSDARHSAPPEPATVTQTVRDPEPPEPAAAAEKPPPSSAVSKYVPKRVQVPRSAKVKGAPGRPATKLPDWCSRKHKRWPPQAMAEALELLRPADTPQKKKLRGSTIYPWAEVRRVAELVSKKYSNEEMGVECVLKPELCWSTPMRATTERSSARKEIKRRSRRWSSILGSGGSLSTLSCSAALRSPRHNKAPLRENLGRWMAELGGGGRLL
jgi:hypothetical protein